MQLRIAAITLLALILSTGWAEARGARHHGARRHAAPGDFVTVVPPFGGTPSDDFKDHPVPSGVPRVSTGRKHHQHRPRHRH
jgi:hypothetical protein